MAIFELELTPASGRVWLDELPNEVLFDPEQVLAGEQATRAPIREDTLRQWAVELLHPSMWHYGLLAASFAPDSSGVFRSRVFVAEPVAKTLTFPVRTVDPPGPEVGLDLRLAQVVANVLSHRDLAFEQLPPSGELSVTGAVVSIGSAPVIFEALAYSLVGLLAEQRSRLDEPRLSAILRAGLTRGLGRR